MKLKFTRMQLIIMLGGVVLVILLFVVYHYATQKPVVGPPETLNVWGTDDAAAMNALTAAYKGSRPNVTITYTQIDPSQYEAKVLQALAAGNGPDVIELTNREIPRWKSTLSPLPTSSTQFNVGMMQQIFPTVVANDFALPNGLIYGVPLSIDTLALFYNQTYFNSAGIAVPPTTWDDFDADILKLKQVDSSGDITQAAVALGGTRASIANADDIVYLFMLQGGTTMISNDHSSAAFGSNRNAAAAVNFYLQFSNAGSPYYTWNDSMGDALQSFAQGKSAMYLGYYAELAKIKAAAPFLNIGVAAMPQPSGATVAINYPKYLGLAATKQGNTAYAWDFILFSTEYAATENIYIAAANVPAAQRAAIATQESAPTLGIFAKQALSAQSWYEANDQQIDSTFDTMLSNIIGGSLSVSSALSNADQAVTGIIRGN